MRSRDDEIRAAAQSLYMAMPGNVQPAQPSDPQYQFCVVLARLIYDVAQPRMRECSKCAGTGELMNDPPAIDIEDYIPAVPCHVCDGTGTVKAE